MRASPVAYVHDAKLRGSLFDAADATGLVAGVDSSFYIDHREPMAALKEIEKHWKWPLGELPEGCEYLVVMPSTRLNRQP